jgi:hypothetical protein
VASAVETVVGEVGAGVGCPTAIVALAVGATVGEQIRLPDGSVMRLSFGAVVGSAVKGAVGVNRTVGVAVGTAVGPTVGFAVGSIDALVGPLVGPAGVGAMGAGATFDGSTAVGVAAIITVTTIGHANDISSIT